MNRSRNIQPRHSNTKPYPDTPISLPVPLGVGIQTLADFHIVSIPRGAVLEAVITVVRTAYGMSQTPTDSCLLDNFAKSVVVVLGEKLVRVYHMPNKPRKTIVVVLRLHRPP